MPTAVQALKAELADVRKKLAGYDDLKAQEERLTGALAILTGNGRSSTRTAAPARRPRGSRRTPRSRSGRQALNEAEIIHAIQTQGGPASAIDIRGSLGLTSKDSNRLSVKLKQMVDNGLLKRTGQRRASRYTPA